MELHINFSISLAIYILVKASRGHAVHRSDPGFRRFAPRWHMLHNNVEKRFKAG
jgi:hypothetical protein